MVNKAPVLQFESQLIFFRLVRKSLSAVPTHKTHLRRLSKRLEVNLFLPQIIVSLRFSVRLDDLVQLHAPALDLLHVLLPLKLPIYGLG